MIAITRAKIGTSPAARRVDAAAQAFAAEREIAAERHRAPVVIDVEPAAPDQSDRESPRAWVARQVAAWAERQPHIVTTFKPRWRAIAEEVAEAHGLRLADLIGPSRAQPLVLARQEAMYRIYDETPLSLVEIGHRLDRDHTSVLHGVRAHAARNRMPLPRQDDGEPS